MKKSAEKFDLDWLITLVDEYFSVMLSSYVIIEF